MGHSATRARVAGILSLCLLLLSSLGATGALASAAPPQTTAPHAAAIVIGTGSCVTGINPCGGAVGPIGDNSCNGDFACNSSSGSIGDNSCNGSFACFELTGTVGNNSCVGDEPCNSLVGDVGNGSCNGLGACGSAIASIGNYSCNGDSVCAGATDPVGDCADNTVTPPTCQFTDARIRRSGGELWGNNIYNETGANQYVSMKIYAGDKRIVYISIQNDGLAPRDYVVCDCTGSVTGHPINYFKGRSNIEITGDMFGATFNTPVLQPGETYVIRARVAVNSSAVPGSLLARNITAYASDGNSQDTVTIWVQRKVNL